MKKKRKLVCRGIIEMDYGMTMNHLYQKVGRSRRNNK